MLATETAGLTEALIFDAEAQAFNDDIARLQAAAGVNPAECLRVGIVAGSKRTGLELMLPALQQGIWITPQENASPPSIAWREHDERLHWPGVRDLHPQSVRVVKWAAAYAQHMLNTGDTRSAEVIADKIDLFVDPESDFARYSRLLESVGIVARDFPPYYVQIDHYNALIEASRNT